MCTPISPCTRSCTRRRLGLGLARGVGGGADDHTDTRRRDATIVGRRAYRSRIRFGRISALKIDLQDAIGILFCTFYFRVPGGSCRPASLPCPLAPAGCGRWCSLRGAISITDHAAASTVRAHHFPFAPWGGLFSLCALHGRLRRLSGAKSFLPTSILRTMGTSSSFFSWSLC